MPLPQLPIGYQDAAYQSLVRSLPGKWFHQLESKQSPLYPLLWGLAGALAHVRNSYDRALAAAIPMLSGGPWLSLHLKSIGLQRNPTESDSQAKDRYKWQFKPTRNTRAGELEALSHHIGLQPPQLRLEGDRSQGKLGQFRLVIDAQQSWLGVDLSFLGTFLQRYVSNGIVPSVDIKLQCLLFQAFPFWRFCDQFPMSWNVQGPIWERRAFLGNLRLGFARNLLAQVSAAEWRSNRDRLLQLFGDGRGNAPGAAFLYLSDEGACPYLLVDYDLQLTSEDIDQTFPPKPWTFDGFKFYNQLVRIGPSFVGSLTVPFLEVPDGPLVNATTPLPLQELHEIYTPFPGDGQTVANAFVVQYYGLSFTTFRVTKFLEVDPPNTDPEFTSPELQLMQSGPWTLALTEGDSRWGNFPPQGTSLTGTVLTELAPASIWWSNLAGTARSFQPLWDGDAVYLAMEFILPRGQALTLRELELRLDSDRINYRRFSLPIDERINAGFVFRVRGTVA